jgi:hypothetical protein
VAEIVMRDSEIVIGKARTALRGMPTCWTETTADSSEGQ